MITPWFTPGAAPELCVVVVWPVVVVVVVVGVVVVVVELLPPEPAAGGLELPPELDFAPLLFCAALLFWETGALAALGVPPLLTTGAADGVPLLDDGAGVAEGAPLLGVAE